MTDSVFDKLTVHNADYGNIDDFDFSDYYRCFEPSVMPSEGFLDAFFNASGGAVHRETAEKICDMLYSVCRGAGGGDELYEYIDGIEDIYPVMCLVREKISGCDGLVNLCVDMIYRSAGLNTVKAGILLLSNADGDENRENIMFLGRNSEFGRCAVDYLLKKSDRSFGDIFEMCDRSVGTGRETLFRLLCGINLSRDVRDRILREGFKKPVSTPDTAYYCAVAGDMAAKLAEPEIDGEIFDGICGIVEGMCLPAAENGMENYVGADAAVADFLKHAEKVPLTLRMFNILLGLLGYLERRLEDDCENTVLNGQMLSTTVLLSRGCDVCTVMNVIEINDKENIRDAVEAAKYMKIDLWDGLFDILKADTRDYYVWQEIINFVDDGRADRLIDFAEENIGFDAVNIDAADRFDLGVDGDDYFILWKLISMLKNFPAKRESILLFGLNSPAIVNRSAALSVLGAWGRGFWSGAVIESLERLKATESDKYIKIELKNTLKSS